MNLTESRKKSRLTELVSENSIVSDRTYNFVMGMTVLYGLVMNIVMYQTFGNMLKDINPIVFIIGYFACCIIGSVISAKSNVPLISFIGYNFIVVPVGMVLSSILESYGGINSELVRQAFLITAGVVAIMIILSVTFPQFFSGLGKILFMVLIGLILVEIILLICGVSQIFTAWIGAGLFSLYIGYDVWRAQQYQKTIDNAVDCAVDIYLDIINLFIRILEILGKNDD